MIHAAIAIQLKRYSYTAMLYPRQYFIYSVFLNVCPLFKVKLLFEPLIGGGGWGGGDVGLFFYVKIL